MNHSTPSLDATTKSLWQDHLSTLPKELADYSQHNLNTLLAAFSEQLLGEQQLATLHRLITQSPEQSVRLLACSNYAVQIMSQHPQALDTILHPPGQSYQDYQKRVACCFTDTDQLSTVMQKLRQLRQLEQLLLIWQQCNMETSMWQIVTAQSAFARACVVASLAWLQANAGIDGPPLVVFALGKLGAQALNLSSDIDIIFMQVDDGESNSNSAAYTAQARDSIRLLSELTQDGFVFRVDTRLRPDGQSGALVGNAQAMRQYYLHRAREWERFAWTRACVVGDSESGTAFLQSLSEFIYKRYADYSVVDWLRSSPWRHHPSLIETEDSYTNLKQGFGGIREIEFITQTFQLIHGGKDKYLRQNNIQIILKHLEDTAYLGSTGASLEDAYRFLRRSEHAVQAIADQQTHRLPKDRLGRLQLACALGYSGKKAWANYYAKLSAVRHTVQNIYRSITEAEPMAHATSMGEVATTVWQTLWTNGEQEAIREQLLLLGLDDHSTLKRLQEIVKQAGNYQLAGPAFLALLPVCMQALLSIDVGYRQRALARFLDMVEVGLGRSNYLILLSETPKITERVLSLCAHSPWLANNLNQHLFALEYLADEGVLSEQTTFTDLKEELGLALRKEVSALPEEEPDLPMDSLRRFKQGWLLQIACADVMGHLPLMKVSDALSAVADTVIIQAVHIAWQHLVKRHGAPTVIINEQQITLKPDDFLVVAYGKLGGLEMSYSSDCDLVFLYPALSPAAMTCEQPGKQAISAHQFFVRLGQRIIHLLSSITNTGLAYKVDMRLRPDGSQGLLVSSMDAYTDYQRKHARLWERQALVRARVINPNSSLAKTFSDMRCAILQNPNDDKTLVMDILDMHKKILAQKKPKLGAQQFHLKYSPGASLDIEFLVQYCLLAHAQTHPEIIHHTDNMRQLDALVKVGVLDKQQGEVLQQAWRHWRALHHACVLRMQKPIVDQDGVADPAQVVQRIWQTIMQAKP